MHSETLFPEFLETRYQFPRQDWSSLKFSSKSKIFNEHGRGWERGDGDNRIFSCLSLRIYLLLNFKKDEVTEVNLCLLQLFNFVEMKRETN